ncbi:hypothetical protein CASFOL_030215 [Castilleja foliolosa]|uniref:Uncharacterized protein n=1 Tax=Castilleja foliolosa TaxID=1961234 RepID=A0ABD3C7C9_9LAMI
MATANETPISAAVKVSDDIRPEEYKAVTRFFNRTGAVDEIKAEHNVKDSFSRLVGGVLKVISIGYNIKIYD